MFERKESQGKLYKVPVRAIVANHNPRNPLGPELQKRNFSLFTGESQDLWKLAVSDDPGDRVAFVQAMNDHEPDFVQWATTFLTVGQLEPVEVRDNGNKNGKGNTYTLIFGCRRCLAILYNWCVLGTPKEPVVEARLSPKLNENGLLHRSIIENIRKDPNPMEKARAIQMAINQGQEIQEVAKTYGVSDQTIRNQLKLLELPLDVQKKIEQGKLKPTKALQEKNGDAPAGSPTKAKARSRKAIQEVYNEFADDRIEKKILAWVLGLREDF